MLAKMAGESNQPDPEPSTSPPALPPTVLARLRAAGANAAATSSARRTDDVVRNAAIAKLTPRLHADIKRAAITGDVLARVNMAKPYFSEALSHSALARAQEALARSAPSQIDTAVLTHALTALRRTDGWAVPPMPHLAKLVDDVHDRTDRPIREQVGGGVVDRAHGAARQRERPAGHPLEVAPMPAGRQHPSLIW